MTKTEPADPTTVRKDRRRKSEARVRMRERVSSVGYAISQRVRKKIEECFGWQKTIAEAGRRRWKNRWEIRQNFELTAAAYNLLRLTKLLDG